MGNGITFKHQGDFSKLDKFLNRILNKEYLNVLDKYGQEGVAALKGATPRDTGLTAESWDYEIRSNRNETSLTFVNTNVNNGVNIAIILQYGHGTRHGGWVAGRDYINPAIRPVFDKIANEAWKEVTSL